MKRQCVFFLTLVASLYGSLGAFAQTPSDKAAFGPGKYCCVMTGVGTVCVVFVADGTYTATGKLSNKDGTARGSWKQPGTQIILTPKEETGCLVGYLRRFEIDEHGKAGLTWLPKTPEDFARSGGAIVYPRYTKVESKGP